MKKEQHLDNSTEEKIKSAARNVFHKKGFAASRTRDIAEEAGINIALLNYYFRSKEKLFAIIIMETMQSFVQTLSNVLNDTDKSFDEKIDGIVEKYIDVLIQEPEIPIFIMSEIRANPDQFAMSLNARERIFQSHLFQQYKSGVENSIYKPLNPIHFLMNLMGLTIFPFVTSPLLKSIGQMDDITFNALMQERKKLIPAWIKLTLSAN